MKSVQRTLGAIVNLGGLAVLAHQLGALLH
jgi:hypothetical protein